MLFAVIMAGGHGERFWPASRRERPKQLLRLLGESSQIEQTVRRLEGLIRPERILVITTGSLVVPIRSLLPELPPENVIGEPCLRDTGPCAALAAALVRHCGGEEAVMCLLPADHAIRDAERFRTTLRETADYIRKHPGTLGTVGLTPTWPATGYGYIRCGEPLPGAGQTVFLAGLEFREKPDEPTAAGYLDSGRYKWNGGIFLWSVATIRQAFATAAPELSVLEQELFAAMRENRLAEKLPDLYAEAPKISIDYAVLEKSRDIVVAEGDFGWDDVGSWTALRNHLEADKAGNIVDGRAVLLDTRESILINRTDDHLIATLGVDNLVVVHTPDVTLVVPSDSAQRIKLLLQQFDTPELEKYL